MLSKKGSRGITHEGQPYRWSVAPDGVYATIVVQHAEENGQRLEVNLRTHLGSGEGQESFTPEIRPITPALVADLIGRAKALGWQPEQAAPPAELSLSEEDALTVRRGI